MVQRGLNVGALFLVAGVSGILSFSFLAAAIGTDYWYLVEVSPDGILGNGSSANSEELNSHSGLWRVCEGRNACIPLIDPFGEESSEVPASLRHLICMHRAFVVLLPLSLILLVFGAICGLVSSLARNFLLLVLTGSYFLLGGTLTLSGLSLYISYSRAAFTETVRMFSPHHFDNVHISFGWSMALAWLSFTTEVITGSLLLLAARMVRAQITGGSAAI